MLKAGGYGGVGAWSRGVGWSRGGPVRVTRRYNQDLTHGQRDVTELTDIETLSNSRTWRR